MKLLFIGNCTFRDDTDSRVCNPFKPLRRALEEADAVILTLQGNITKRQIPSNCQSVGNQLVSLKRIIPHTPIIIDYKNIDLLNTNPNGKRDTLKFLTKHGFIYTPQVIKPLLYGTLCVFSCMDEDLTTSEMLEIVVPVRVETPSNLTLQYLSYIKSYVSPIRTVIVNLRIKPYSGVRVPSAAMSFSKLLIELGVDVVQIHADRSKPLDTYRSYKNGIIICGLGELINCRASRRRYSPISSELCTVNTISKYYNSRIVDKRTINECIIPRAFGRLRHRL